jgi:hypothetical protein
MDIPQLGLGSGLIPSRQMSYDDATDTPDKPTKPLGVASLLGTGGLIPSKPIISKIKIKDNRDVDYATNQKLNEGNRMSADVDPEYIKHLIDSAKKYGVDPYTTLAIGLNETGLKLGDKNKYNPDPIKSANPFMISSVNDDLPKSYTDGDSLTDLFFKIFKEKQDTAKKMGKNSEEDMIQAYNGYGTIKGRGKLYGIDTDKNPIDFNKNPIYGKRIIDIRDNIIKKHPELVKLIEGK